MSERETPLMRAIRLAVNRSGLARIVRNNTGFDREHKVRYGLGVGGADLVGLIIGTGRVLALEVKTSSGRATADQERWIAAVNRLGGYAAVVRSVESAIAHVQAAANTGRASDE